MREPREPRRRLEVVELRSRDGDSCVVAISDGRGGEALLQLDPPYSSPQFLPDVGEPVVLDMSGPVPQVVARQIAVDAISAREARFDLMTALLVMGAKIVAGDPAAGRIELDSDSLRLYRPDGVVTIRLDTLTGNALVTGEYRSAESGSRFVINPDGDKPGEIRFYSAIGNTYGSIMLNAIPEMEIVGPVNAAGFTAAVELNAVGVDVSQSKGLNSTSTTQDSRLSLTDAFAQLAFTDNTLTPDASGGVIVGPYDASFGHSALAFVTGGSAVYVQVAGVTRIQANATGVGFYGVTPVAKPTVAGSRGGNAALASLLTALANLGLITNSSTA